MFPDYLSVSYDYVKIDTLNFTMDILTILICPLKTYIIGLYMRHNLISINIFFNILFFFGHL